MPRCIVYDGGFKIIGTPLAFKGCRNPGLLFVSDLDMKIPAGTKRVIGSDIAVGRLKHRKRPLDAIAVSCDRMFKLGRMDLRLLPSGLSPGACLMEIAYNSRKILYCSGLRTKIPLSGVPATPTPCDILLLDFDISVEKFAAPRTVKPKLQKWQFDRSGGVASALLSDSVSGICDAVDAFANDTIALFAQRTTYKLLRSIAVAENKKLPVKCLGAQWPATGVVFSSSSAFLRSSHSKNTAIPVCYCGRKNPLTQDVPLFPFGESDHIENLIQFAKKCGAHTVAISPSGGEDASHLFKKAGFNVVFSRIPHQLKLPL